MKPSYAACKKARKSSRLRNYFGIKRGHHRPTRYKRKSAVTYVVKSTAESVIEKISFWRWPIRFFSEHVFQALSNKVGAYS